MSSTLPAHASIREKAQASDYSARALAAIVQIAGATAPQTLIGRLADATAALGASASLYTAAVLEGDRDLSCFSLLAGHPAYAHAQNEIGPLIAHPWFRFARTHLTSGSDRQVGIEEATDAAALQLAREYGFRAYFVVPTPSGQDLDRLGMLCVGSEHPDDFEGPEAGLIRTLARSLAAELHEWLLRYLHQRLVQTARLERTDMKLLALEHRGLQTKEIATLTGLSRASVDSRFQRINMRLHCSSRRASALRAVAYGLLEPR
ncbi:hypothetical protein PEC18_36685 [Paucibacter sp. O1-1]|nr:hypothetical protein [Paucibacter sp. O1-1]MDA3831191.1 hypothetical protein [Paucibacter sp. O1-1]